VIDLQTGAIKDHNGNLVPDGTAVQFNFAFTGDHTSNQEATAYTTSGVAKFTYRIDTSGPLQITAGSGQATQSDVLTLFIPSLVTSGPTFVLPTLEPSLTPTATLAPTFTPSPTATEIPLRSGKPDMGEWTLAMMLIALGAGLSFTISYRLLSSLRWAIRWGLCTVLGGLAVYIYLSSGLPGGASWVQQSGTGGILGFSFLGVICGWLVGLAWWLENKGLAHQGKNQGN
jgi:hypothetical protein